MAKSPLALHGGRPTISAPLAPFKTLGEDEANAAADVIRSGILSGYVGAPGESFMGGPHVRAFERKAARYFGVKHAVATNSWTSGLIAAVAAIGIEPGDEIITTPWTMAATATAILHFNGIPVFADIDQKSFNIDPRSAEAQVSARTRAILAVDIFGQSADMKALRDVADRHGIKVLSDTAQAPGVRYGERFAGTLADIGGYSLNYHKHIHCGEGGIIVTDDERYAERMCRIRNHAECIMGDDEPHQLSNMIGYNFRMGELEAAIASIQLDKLGERVASRQVAARQLGDLLNGLSGLALPSVSPSCTHAYYVYGMTLDVDALQIPRGTILAALRAEGVPWLMEGYQNVHRLPLFTRKIAFGSQGFPWNQPFVSRDVPYGKGVCPVAERLHDDTFMGLNFCMGELGKEDVEAIADAFHKVWAHLDDLRSS